MTIKMEDPILKHTHLMNEIRGWIIRNPPHVNELWHKHMDRYNKHAPPGRVINTDVYLCTWFDLVERTGYNVVKFNRHEYRWVRTASNGRQKLNIDGPI